MSQKTTASLKIISLGLGQQSTALYYMSSLGDLPRADHAVFVDPGAETAARYADLEQLLRWQQHHDGIPIHVTGKKSITHDLINGTNSEGTRFISIPAFTKSSNGKTGMLRRQCTVEYKVKEVNRAIRKLYGLKPHQPTPATELWMGITVEELSRLRQPRYHWQTFVYPFCSYRTTTAGTHSTSYNLRYTRHDCQRWLWSRHLPVPVKSACYFCPYHSDHSWLQLKRTQPDEWDKAVELDKIVRDSRGKGVQHSIYLHRSCKPLDEVDLNENQPDLFTSECEGHCGT